MSDLGGLTEACAIRRSESHHRRFGRPPSDVRAAKRTISLSSPASLHHASTDPALRSRAPPFIEAAAWHEATADCKSAAAQKKPALAALAAAQP
jgi:hypothetical protein